VTDVDEINILACLTAHRLGVPKKIARVRNEDYYVGDSGCFEEIDHLINPDREAVLALHELLMKRAATNIYDFAEGRVQVIGARVGVGAMVVGKSLGEIEREIGSRWALVASISRAGKTIIPCGEDILQEDDEVFIVGRRGKIADALQFLSPPSDPVEAVMIAGANPIGVSLARQLTQEGIAVKLLENHADLAHRASLQLDNTLVLLGDPTDLEFLESEGLADMDGFVAVSEDDDMNLMASLLARTHGARKTIALIRRPNYVPLLSTIGVDAAVSPRLSTADAIMGYFRRGNVLSLTSLKENDAEIVELEANRDSKVVGIPIAELEWPRNALLGAIIKPYQVVIPRGGDEIDPGDRVLVFALPDAVAAVQKLF
jgi:trk system potassium uptake protein TrkA